MRLRFAEVKPPGNTTIFVLDPVPVPEQAKIAVALMDSSVLGGERVGFVTLFPEEGPPGTEPAHDRSRGIAASLRMMGGVLLSCACPKSPTSWWTLMSGRPARTCSSG
ncbi:MAG: hypothetical protein ACM3ZO_07015 [Clostridia bacterium]